MKKRVVTAAFCVAMGLALCACNTTKQTGTGVTPTTAPTDVTPEATATPSAMMQAYENLPITNYEDYVASTVLPEGYLGFEIDAVTEADVDAYVQEMLEANKDRIVKDGPIEEGDIAIIDYVGRIDGVAFDGGTAYSEELEIGNSGYIPGFDEGLIGAKKGEKVLLNVTFPEDYLNKDLAGKPAVFEVQVNSIAQQVLPEFTDELVTTVTGGEYTTTEDFLLFAEGFLEEERKYKESMEYLVTNTTFGKMNDAYIEAALALEKEYYAMQYGFDSLQALEAYFGAENSEVLWAMLKKQIIQFEQERIVLYSVAAANDITLSEEEYQEDIAAYAMTMQMTVEQVLATQSEEALRQSMRMEKALEFILDNIVVKGEE